MSTKKRYDKVSQMVQDASESKDFSEAFDQRLASRQLVKQLMIMRVSKGLSQEDMADALGCSQSRISKLEASDDGDVRTEDIVNYASALGLQTQFVFFKKDMTLAEQVKSHFFETKELMERLAGMAVVDPVIAKGIAGFFSEACVNFVTMLVDNVKALPTVVHDDFPLIKMVSQGSGCKAIASDCDSESEAAKDADKCHTNGVIAHA